MLIELSALIVGRCCMTIRCVVTWCMLIVRVTARTVGSFLGTVVIVMVMLLTKSLLNEKLRMKMLMLITSVVNVMTVTDRCCVKSVSRVTSGAVTILIRSMRLSTCLSLAVDLAVMMMLMFRLFVI